MSKMDSPLWALGLRPFYLLAAIFALAAVPVWLASYVGLLQWNGYRHVHWSERADSKPD
jgi:uncharacterized protein involved in response to NO